MGKDRQRDARSEAGFTLVELTVVIVIVAILGALAMPRFFDNRGFAERGYFEEVAEALRYARAAAVDTGCPVRFELTAGGYSAAQQQPLNGRCNPADSSFAQAVRLGDGTTLSGAAPTGVSAAPASVIVFDALGATNLAADRTITIGSFTLTVSARSGYTEIT